MELDSLTAGLFTSALVWNTGKRDIVSKMTQQECMAIAKRCTYNLRDRSPEIRRYIEQCGPTRLKYAKLLFTQQLVNAGLLDSDEVAQYKRMSRVAQAQIKHQTTTAEFYKSEAGYRICCLTQLTNTADPETLNSVLRDLDMLSGQQNTLDQATLLEDLMRIILKRGSKYAEFNVTAQLEKYQKALNQYTQALRNSLEQCTRVNSTQSVTDFLEQQKALQPPLSDLAQSAMSEFASTKACFEVINREHSTYLAKLAIDLIDNDSAYRMQAA